MIQRNILGLTLNGKIDPTITGLTKEHFTDFHFKNLWEEMCLAVASKITPNVITMADIMKKYDADYDWFTYLIVMANDAVGAHAYETHVKAMKREYQLSQLKDIGNEILEGENGDINDYIRRLMALNVTEKKYLHTMIEASDDAFNELEATMAGVTSGVTTGFESLDHITGGFHNSDLIIIAARSAMGKTALMLNCAAANRDRALIFSTEQSRIQAAQRMFSIYGNVENHKLRKGDINDEEMGKLTNAVIEIRKNNGYIYDKSGPYISEIEATAREVYHNRGCSAIYLDYLQRIKHENPSLPNHEKVGDIAMRLKELARELDIPVIALAQVNRNVESRPDKRPLMGDIKDSGTIEQEADQIITLYRDEVYNEGSPDTGTAEITFKKNRHGGTGMVRVSWHASTMRFTDIQKHYA